MIWKMFPLVKFEVLECFLNTLTADDKYPVPDCENLQFSIQMQLSKKRKTFSNFSFRLCNLHQNLNIFKPKMMLIANEFPKLETVKNLVRPLSKKRRFRKSFDSQHVKESQTLVKSAWEHFYHFFITLG